MRHLKPDPVAREDLEYIIEAATMAPSAGNTQMWAYVVVTDPEQNREDRRGLQGRGRPLTSADGVLADPDHHGLDRQRVYSKASAQRRSTWTNRAAIIVTCLHGRRAPRQLRHLLGLLQLDLIRRSRTSCWQRVRAVWARCS